MSSNDFLANPATNESSDADTDADSDKEYVVEAILQHRRRGNEIQYKIKWEGYPMEDATWESEENLTGCPKLLSEYKRQHMTPGRKRKPAGDGNPRSGPEATTSAVKIKKQSRAASESSSAPNLSPPAFLQDFSPEKKQNHDEAMDDDANLPDVVPVGRRNSDPNATNAGNGSTGSPFDRGAVAKKVLGVTRYPDGTLWILVSWTNPFLAPELVPNVVANEKIPELMIAYYEKHLQWKEYSGRKNEPKPTM